MHKFCLMVLGLIPSVHLGHFSKWISSGTESPSFMGTIKFLLDAEVAILKFSLINLWGIMLILKCCYRLNSVINSSWQYGFHESSMSPLQIFIICTFFFHSYCGVRSNLLSFIHNLHTDNFKYIYINTNIAANENYVNTVRSSNLNRRSFNT